MSTEENRKFVEERWIPAAAGNDADAMSACFAGDATFTYIGNTPLSGTYDMQGFKEVNDWMQPRLPNPDDVMNHIKLVVADGDAVAIFGLTQKKVGEQMAGWHWCHLMRFNDEGTIREFIEYIPDEILNMAFEAFGHEYHPTKQPTRDW